MIAFINFNRRLIHNKPTFVFFYYNKEKPNNRTERFKISIIAAISLASAYGNGCEKRVFNLKINSTSH